MQKKLVLFLFTVALTLWVYGGSGDALENDSYYFDKLFNKTVLLASSLEEIVVVFHDGANFEAVQRSYNLEKAQILDEKKRIGIYRPAGLLPFAHTIKVLNTDTMVEKAAPAYIDQEGFTKYCVPTELTVRFKAGVDKSRMMEILSEVGSEVLRKQWTPGYFTIKAPESKGYFETIRALCAFEEVKFSEPSIISFNDALFTPNDSHFDGQWALKNTGQIPTCDWCTPYSDHDIDAEDGWDIGRGDSGVVISIIDTGMDLDHPDLEGNLLPRNGEDWDFADPNDDVPEDTYGHGTKCSGIAAAVTDNGLGVAGVAHFCQIMPLRINLQSGMNQNRADAINYATSRRPDFDGLVLSNSWYMSSGDFTAVHDAVVNAYANDVLVCFAAGNFNGAIVYPAAYPEAMAIAATSPCDERKSPSSCDGEGWGTCYGPELDCAAPGVKIYTTSVGGGYTPSFNGTSSACPHVAGLGGLIWSLNPSLSNVEIRQIINESSDQVGGYYYDPATGKSLELGHGRININNAMEMALPQDITWREHRVQGHISGTFDTFPVDLDRDGDMDILGAALEQDAVIWWENLGPFQFPGWREHLISDHVDGAFTVAAGDLNGDSYVDIVAGGKYTWGIYWYLNDGHQNFREFRADGGYGVIDICITHINEDRCPDILGALAGSDEITWWKNVDDRYFIPYPVARDFDYAASVFPVDMDGDFDMDVVGAAMDADKISWFENDGQQNFTEHVINSHRYDGASDVFAIDMDFDGDMDVLGAAASTAEYFLWWENRGSQQYPPWREHQVRGHFIGTMDIWGEDLDDDDDIDIVAAAPYDDAIIWWENLGPFGVNDFEEHQVTREFKGAWEISVIDMDGDVDLDILGAGANAEGYVAWWESDLN